MEHRGEGRYLTSPWITEALMSMIFVMMVLIVTVLESEIIGVKEFNLIDLSSVIIIIAVYTSGLTTGIVTSVACGIFSMYINSITNMDLLISLFTNRLIFVLILYAAFLLLKRIKVRNDLSMYISIALATIVKKIFALAWVYAVRGELSTPLYEHIGSMFIQIVLYIGFIYLILDRIRKIILENNKLGGM